MLGNSVVAGSCVRFIVQSLSYVILMYIVLLIGLAFNCVIVPSLVGLVCLCSVVPLLLNLVDEVTSALHERPAVPRSSGTLRLATK